MRLKKVSKRAWAAVLSVCMTATSVTMPSATVSAAPFNVQSDWQSYASDELVGVYHFGSDVTKSTLYQDGQYGFSDVQYSQTASGWVSGVYYPREASRTKSAASYITNGSGYLTIGSKVWTETESTGFGVYTYETTSTFDMELPAADYQVEVTFVNPTSNAYTAYLEAEDITRVTGITVKPGETVKKTYTACLVDGVLNLKFLAENNAVTEPSEVKNVYVSDVKVTRLATEEAGAKPTIFIASDSTVQTYESNQYPQAGWGQTLYSFFGDFVEERENDNCNYSQSQTYETTNVIVENRALGGRSSKSFVDEGKLDDLLEDVKPGDYLFVQWGHNDATSARPNRYVSPADFELWMQYYVDGALQRGATPVLVTPVARHSYDSNGKFASNFEAYRQVMLKMSNEQNIPLVDLTMASINVCNNFGVEGAKSLFLMLAPGEYPNFPSGSTDATHLQYYGAYKFAQCIANEIQNNTNSALDSLKTLVEFQMPTAVPDKTEGLAATTIGASSVSIAWDKTEGAELYYVYRQELADGQDASAADFTNAEKYSVSSVNRYTDSGCIGGATYAYAVRSFNELGLGELSETLVVTTKSSLYKYDFNYDNSPTLAGWVGVNQNQMYNAEQGYGWLNAPNGGRNRSNNGNADSSAMADDFCLGAGEFAVDLPNGDYELKIYACDLLPGTSTIKPSYTAEGVSIGSISTKQALGSVAATVRVTDGQLNVVVGGTNLYINGLEITPLLLAPTGLNYSEMNISGNQATFLIGFTGIDEAASYRIYQKTSTDKKFSVVKTFTTSAYREDELSCRAMAAVPGETYEYYLTAVTADGTESAPTNTVTIAMIDTAVAVPAAPANVHCITAESGNMVIGWNAIDGALRYNIYRSNKAEGEKGFNAFVKVGETNTNSFTDTDSDVTANIPYYYKVQAMNVGGVGAISEACQTPVTNTLIPENLEKLTDRGVVAVNLAGADGGETVVTATDRDGNEYTEGVYLSWRSFEADPSDATYTVYRNGSAIASDVKATNLLDAAGTAADIYRVEGSSDAALGLKSINTKVWQNKYLELQLFAPDVETMPDGNTCNYSANDMTVGDLDGDGQLELIVKWYPSNAQDNSGGGYTGKTFLDGYDINFSTGEVSLLWRIDMGVNIRSGAHYTQFQVWDYDGDGKAEIAVKTADGTSTYKSTNGTDTGLVEVGFVGACSASELPVNSVSDAHDYRNASGYILSGPEYFTIFNGEDGTIIDTCAYTPGRGNVSAWGDAYGNRVDRFLSATAYLDGENPYAVFCRGYYSRTCLTAYYLEDTNGDGIGDKLKEYWAFDTNNMNVDVEVEAQGNHGLSINDIDNDGKDEIIYGSIAIDHDGSLKYSTGLGHGDAMHVSDWFPWNDGLEVMQVHEHDNVPYHVEVHDAETGEVLAGFYTGKDTGRGVAADIDPTSVGAEWWSIASPTYESNDEPSWDSKNGEVYAASSTLSKLVKLSDATPASNFSVFWDGDLLSEILDHRFNNAAYVPIAVTVAKWDYENQKEVTLLDSTDIWSSNGTKGNPGLVADILGDWREEIVARCSADNNKVRIYTTTIQTDYVVPCLLEDLAYREGVAWQNIAYNQPANLSYLLSEGVVTSTLAVADKTSNSVTIGFTPANDGKYGHEIEGYAIYRAENDGEYQVINTIAAADLPELGEAIAATPGETKELVSYKFDFGGKDGKNGAYVGACQDGYTEITSATPSYENSTTGYGFTTEALAGITFRYYNGGTTTFNSAYDSSFAALFDDCAMGWNSDVDFRVDVPNGEYEVKVLTAHVSGTAKNLIYIEDLTTSAARYANKNEVNVTTKTVTVEDGVLNVYATLVQGYPGAVLLNGLEITQLSYADAGETTEEDAVSLEGMYLYKDSTAVANTTYSYKVAAVVDGKPSYRSHAVTAKTLVKVGEVSEFALAPIVQDLILEAGQTVADVLPQTVEVIDMDGNVSQSDVTWDVSAVDLTKAGVYTVYGKVAGYTEMITKTLEVVANAVASYSYADVNGTVYVAQGSAAVELPVQANVVLKNGAKLALPVTWDAAEVAAFDVNAITAEPVILHGTVTVSVSNLGEQTLDIAVQVKSDYIVTVSSLAQVEAVLGSSLSEVEAALPGTVAVEFKSGKKQDAAINWNMSAVTEADFAAAGAVTLTGTIEDYDGVISIVVNVNYAVLYQFDFGISNNDIATGWTGVTVNAKGGTKTVSSLGIAYNEDKGYGFADGSKTIEGRNENYTAVSTVLPQSVYKDFALPDGNTFLVDVPNGLYEVSIVGGSALKSTAKADVEGRTISVGNAAGEYTVGVLNNVEILDGQLTIDFAYNVTSRLDAIIIRQVEKYKAEVKVESFIIHTDGAVDQVGGAVVEADGNLTATAHDGYRFAGWYQVSGSYERFLTEDSTILVTEGEVAIAKFVSLSKHTVRYMSKGTILDSKLVTEGELVEATTEIPVQVGYRFAGWDYNFEQPVTADTDIQAIFEKETAMCTLTLVNAEASAAAYAEGTAVTVHAKAELDGETFSYWLVNGSKVYMPRNYEFKILQSTTVEAVYAGVVEEEVTVVIKNAPVVSVEAAKITFVVNRVVPQKYTVAAHGILLTNDDSIGSSEDTFIIGATGVIKGTAAGNTNVGIYEAAKGKVAAGETWYGRGYVIYKNAAGEQFTVYGNIESATLKSEVEAPVMMAAKAPAPEAAEEETITAAPAAEKVDETTSAAEKTAEETTTAASEDETEEATEETTAAKSADEGSEEETTSASEAE